MSDFSLPGPKEARALAGELATWFEREKRDLPWRGNPTPYEVWVSEIMLQQTRVEVVRDFYRRWMRRFPTLPDLARAELSEALGLWQGLGYYSRARRLHEGARFVLAEFAGELPRRPEELLTIPGIGPYTAGAIASLAFGEVAELVDGNVMRVLSRLFAYPGDPKKKPLGPHLWKVARLLVEQGDPSSINQGLMELGALVCTPRSPSCSLCPWKKRCAAFARGEVDRYPELVKSPKATALSLLSFVVEAEGHVLVQTLPEDARWWAGLALLPTFELGSGTGGAIGGAWVQSRLALELAARSLPSSERVMKKLALEAAAGFASELGRAPGPGIREIEKLPALRHQVTRYRIDWNVYRLVLEGKRRAVPPGARWTRRTDLRALAWPGPLGRLIERLTME